MRILIMLAALMMMAFAGRYELDSQRSYAWFSAKADLFLLANDEINGTNRALSGYVTDENGIKGRVVIEADGFKTQNQKRDTHLKEILKSERYPTLNLYIDEVLEDQVRCRLDMHGHMESLTLPITQQVRDNEILLSAKATIKYQQFGIEPPVFGGIIKRAKPDILVGATLYFKKP